MFHVTMRRWSRGVGSVSFSIAVFVAIYFSFFLFLLFNLHLWNPRRGSL
jgi:hypothetical protein